MDTNTTQYDERAKLLVLSALSSLTVRAGGHVTGQELSFAIRDAAVKLFGITARLVLESWGLHSTNDFGAIVYELLDAGEMSKTENDRIEDFDHVFDWEAGFDVDLTATDESWDQQFFEGIGS